MAIEISNKESTPPITYDRIFLNSLKIIQDSENKDNTTPRYRMTIEYTIYGVDDDNNRYFKPKVRIIQIDDYITVAQAKAMQDGNMNLLVAMQAIEQALANIIEDQTDLGTTTVVS